MGLKHLFLIVLVKFVVSLDTRLLKQDLDDILEIKNPSCIYGLCSEISDYPVMEMWKVMKEMNYFQDYFDVVSEPYSNLTKTGKKGRNLCESSLKTIYPKVARNRARHPMYIINLPEYKQEITFEVCENPGKHCLDKDCVPNNYKTLCVQQFSTVKLVAFSPKDYRVQIDTFPIPSGCACTYSMV